MAHHHLTERGKKILSITSILIFLAVTALIFFFVGKPLLQFASEPDKFREWINSFGSWGSLAFIGIMILQVVVAIIPGEPLEVGAGYAFGTLEGTILCLIAVAIGTTLVFCFVRRFGVKALEVFFPVEKINSLRFLRNNKQLYLLTAIIFFIPGTPKDLVTYFMGLTHIKLLPLLAISVFARIPSVLTSTISGNALGEQRYLLALIVIIATVIISAAGVLIYRHISNKHQQERNEEKNAQKDAELPVRAK